MAMRYIERELRITGDPKDKALADIISGARRVRGQDIAMPRRQTALRRESRADESERDRQAHLLAKLFSIELGYPSEEDYIESLPQFPIADNNTLERFNLGIIVETRVPWERQAEILNIRVNDELHWRASAKGEVEVKDWQEDPFRFETPEEPYVALMPSPTSPNPTKPIDTRRSLEADERGGTIYDGIALYIAHPELILGKRFRFDLIGTQAGTFIPRIGSEVVGGSQIILGLYSQNYLGSKSSLPLICFREIN